MLQLGELLPQLHQVPINSWVDWSNVSKVHTYTHTHQAKQSKAYGSRAKYSYFHPVNQHWDGCAPLRHLSLVQANPPGAGLVTHRRTVQVSGIAEPEVPQQPQYHQGQLSICLSSKHQVPIDVTAGRATSPVGTRPPGPHLYRLEQFSCSRKQQQHQSGHTWNRTHNLLIRRLMP